jgi:hypothetical protein
MAKGEDGLIVGTFDAAEPVVGWGIWPIQAYRHARYSAVLELVDGFRGQQGRGAGRDVGAQSKLDAKAR